MSKRRNDDTLRDDAPAAAKRSRKPTGFRVARPPAENASRSASSSSSSRITTLVLGRNGRIGGRRKDKNHLTTSSKNPPNQLLQCSLNLILQRLSFRLRTLQMLTPAQWTSLNLCLNIFPRMLSRQSPLTCQLSQNPNERERMLGYVFFRH
jgi:hypothetical protein